MEKAKVTQTEAALAVLCSEAGLNSQEISKIFFFVEISFYFTLAVPAATNPAIQK